MLHIGSVYMKAYLEIVDDKLHTRLIVTTVTEGSPKLVVLRSSISLSNRGASTRRNLSHADELDGC